MDILLNPNVAYVLLVVGMVLTLLAILTPGTGMLEVGAFFALVLAGYITFRIGINPWALIVLGLTLIPFIYATRKPKRTLWLGLSIVMMLASSLYLFNIKGWIPVVNPILATLVSLLVGGFLWMVVGKTMQAYHTRPIHDLSVLIDQIGETKTAIHENGSVQVAGELWSARSIMEIPAGKPVRVVDREGFILLVEIADTK
jgi:membrane-bound serine protease (ClpP class)